jgi:site-specific DNA-cytosine methylase
MTKYKPLYALYKGLKEHGTDLPDSYGSFERSMTQAGNAGASNRRNFYQSLKDSNYDVPDTYEKFYESMFVPVNNTTSRARKIGETPITDEDRKGFTLGAQDIRMNASKFAAGDALRYNKLKQRKQKQRKDFGRVKVGTNKTPYAPTDNVVKDEGLNTYVTSDSSDTTNLDYAQQKQAVLDEQNQAYMNAIERGDIPMASETIDKNGLYDLQENIGKDGTEVTEKGIKEQAEARLNVAYQKQKDIMAQLSAAMDGGFSTFEERMQLSATKNKIDEEVRNLEALAGKESSGFWNTLADVANTIPLLHNIKEGINYLFGDDTSKDMYKAIANSMVQSNWDFGVSDIQNSVKLEQIRDKINKGEAVTKEEKEFLDANQKADKSAEWVDQYGSRAYRWTSGAGVSVPYMIDFGITGGLPLMRGMTQAFGRGAMKIAAKRGWGKLAHNIMYYTGVAAGDIIGSYAMATTVQGLKTGSDVLNRHLGTLYQDEKGNYAFGTFDENGNLLHEGGESFGKALYKGVTAAMLENYTEKMFGHWHLKSGAFDLLDKNPYTKKLADFFRGVGNKNWYLDTKKFSSKFGIGSYPEEVAEEIVNIPLNAWLVGDNSIKELGDRKTWEDIAGSMAISVGSMAGMASTPHIVRGAANQGIKAYDFAAFYVFKNRLNQANQRASEILGDEWEVIKNRIDSAPNENLGKISADLHKQVSEGKYSEEQLDAAWAYIQNLRVMRGYNLAKTMEMQAKAMTGDENTPADIRQKQLNAAYAAGQETEGENKHLAQVEYEKQKFNLASALGVSDSELENMTDEQISSNLGLDDNLDNVIYNYQNAKALYDGIMDNAQNAVDTATKVAAQRVDAMTNVEDGTIKQALVKGTMGKDDYPVYVISGNIETHDDGIINYSDSDSMVIVYNVATGRKETIPVSMLSAVNPYIQNAEEFKAQAVNEAKEKTITELSNVIDGKLVDGSQFTMEDAKGQIHDYIIEGIDEQGNCIISVDGTILPEPLSLDAIQQQYDQSNVARSVKNDQTAQEPEQTTQEPEQIQQESQPIEDKFDYAKITNENDGKVKRVDVTDEEGKNRFPNAKAVFLIQDKGAMPKFVVMDEEGNLTSYVGKRGDKIHLKGEMTIDEYKKQRQEGLQMIAAENADSSMIEENSGAIEVEDNEEGKLLNRNDDGAQTEQNQPSASVTTSQEDAAGSSESKDTNISANGNENNESLTFEDGTPIPVDVNGEVDLSQTDATHAAEWYDNNLGEDADDWLDGEIKKAKKVLEQAKNKKLAGTKPSELVASKKEKEAAIADAQAHYDSAISIRDSLKERRIAKVEDTAEGRKELIEKARRKFARLKSAVKDDAEAVSQLYRDTIGYLLHRLYDGTGIDVTDTIPLTAEEYVASNLGAHSLNYEGTETSKGVKQETGLSREDFAKTQLLAADGKGTTIDALVHSLWENLPSNLESLDTQDIRNALIGVLNSGFKASEARNFVENIRIAQAENILEEQKRAQENAAYAEQHKAEPEAELKAKSDEKAELKAKSEEKLDNESSNESNDLGNDLDNEKTNDKINDNINAPEVPEDATDENPLGAQRDSAPFSPKHNTKVTNSSEERKAMVKKNAVRSEDVLDHSIGKKMRKSLSRIAKMMGADIIYLHSADSNGWYDEKTNTIYLALDSADVLGTQFVFGHEMTHEIKAKNPAAFEELKNLVKNMMGEDAFNTITDKTQQKYEKGGATYWKDRNAMEEEVVADQIGNWIHDANYAHTLMMKMSHPLLAKLHEIVNRIRFAFTGTEYSDNAKLILRSIEQAYMKTANGQVTNSETGEDVSFSLRQKPEPKKKGIGYKVFVLKDGKLYPPMVANPDGAATPVGVWLDADAAPIAGESKTGRPQVKQGGKGTQGGSGKLAYRPGWHLGIVPYAIQFNRKDADGNKTLFPKNFVFAEVEYAADVDYQEEARQEGINPSGKYQHSLAGLKHLPTDGYYMYRTNPNPETDPWVITGAMKVNRILTRAEQAELVKNAGREPQQIQEGDIVTDDVVNSINQEIADAPKFSLKSKPVRYEAGKKLSDEEKKEVLSTLKDAYKVNGVPYHIEETAGGKEKRVYEPTADSYVVSDITNRPLRYYITLPDGRVAHPTEVYPNISDNEVKSSATKQGLLDDEADQIISAAIGNMKDIANNTKAVEVLTELQNLPHETHDVGYGMNNAQSYNYKTGIFTSDAAQAIDYVVRRMRRKEDVPAEIPAALKKAVDDSYGMVDNLIDGMSNTKVGAAEIKPVGVGAFGNIYNQFRGKAKAAIEFLKKVRGGEAVGALYHKDIGDIDLVWGKEGTGHSDGYGLSKLVKYHPEVLDNLQEILNDMRVVSSSKNRVNLESETHKAGVRLTWDGERKSWLLTAFKKETSASDKRTDTAATSLEGDTALSQTEGSAAKIDNSSETTKKNGEKFSLKDEKTMFGMHNISVDKLRKAIKQGGFAAPSMGVVDSKNGIYSDYGEITLIPKAEKLAKRTGKNAGTFTADAWTPTYPQVERIMNKQGEKAFNTDMNVKLGDVDNGIYSNVRESWKGYLSSGDVRDGLYWHYLFDNGMNPETIYQTGKYDNDITNEVMRVSDNGNKTDYTDKEVAELIQLMNKATGKDNDVDAQREKLKVRIASAEKQGNHLLVALKKKRLEELEGVENFYIAADFVNDVVRNNRKNGKVDVHDTMGTAKKKVEDNKKLSDDFPSWLDKKTEEYGVEEMLYNGTTPSGKPKYIHNTIENAVKLMKKQGVAGGYTAFGSELGVFIAKNSPEVNTLAAMKNAKDKLIPFGDERHNQIKDKITKEFLELSDEIRVGSNNRYAFDDSGVSRMVELTDHKGNEKEYLKKAYNIEVSDEWMDRYNKLLDTIKKDYKVFYFETKFMRPYGLDEFEKAIVPSDTPSDVVDALKKAGIDVSSYERGNAEDRQKVTMDAINSSDNIRFSLAGVRGAAAADKAEERNARMDNLSVARKMEEEKKDAKAIKMATGWERGADGKWRYEMPDAKIKDTMDVGGGHIVKRYEDDMLWNGGKLFDVIDAPELFKAYPQLKGVRIDTDAIMNDMPSHGEYDSKTNTITIHADELKYMNDILNHEIQHAIQGIEGFATGGSPTTIRGEVKKRFNEVTKQIKQLRAEGKEDEAKALIEKNRGLYDAYMKNDDFNSYKSLAGEVEARNVQERMNMTPEERRKTLAESTEDVARKDQIFLGVGDVSFSLRDMADGKESGAADMAEDLKSLNTPDEVDDAIKTAIDDMPSGWKMANKKMIHIAQALGENRKAEIAGEEPKFSLKDGTLIKAGTYFSGGGLVEEGLKGIIDPVVAVEYDEKISGVYRNNFGQHIVTADVRDVDPKELVKQIDGEVEYFHASPVCKNYSQAKSNHAEVELDKETAASTAEFINAVKPRVVTIENVKGYKDSDAMKIITDALDANGYTWDADVYNAADYGGYTNRERLIVRAVRDGKLPEKPKKIAHKSGWYEAVADIIPTLTEKKNGVAPWMDIRLKADGIDWRNIDKPLYVMGSAYADGKVPHAFADELLPTLRTKSGDVIVMPDGKVYRAMGRVLARVSGVSDDYKMPFSESLSHTIIGNGIPTQLTEHVIAPLLTGSDPKFSIRTYHGTGASFDKFDLSHALEGEGSETFGHGVYVTNSSKIGREYAQRAKQRKMADLYKNMRYPDGVKDDIFKRRVFGEMVNDVATGGSVASAKEFAKKRVGADANDIQRTLENLKDREKGTEYEQNLKDRLAEYKDALKWIDSIDEDYLTQGNANRYDVDIPDDNGNYLGWNDSQNFPLEKWYRLWEITHHGFNENEYFKDGGARYDKDRIERIIQMKLDSPENGMQRLPTLKGEELYHALEDFFDRERPSHGAELASRALSEIGFVGIKYPAGLIHGGAEEGDYNYVIFDENNANIVGNTKFSLRGSTPYDKQMEEWMEKNHLEKGAVPMEKPIMKEGENIFDYANRMVEWTRNQNLWKTAPKQTGFQDALDKWKADNGLSPDAYPPVRPHRENYSTEIGYAEDLEEYNKKKELWKSAPKPKDFDLSVDLEDMNKQLRNIRRAVLNQKNYDQRTVKAVSDLVRKMLNIGWGDGLSRGKVGNLLSAAKNATGANDVKKYLDKAMGILAENYLNRLSTAYDNLINTKGARADQSGVIKMGSLDANGQAFMSEYKKAINMDDSSLNTYIANIEEDSAKNEDNVEMNDYRLAGIQAAIMYKQQIGGNDADIAELKRQIGELKNKKDATKEDKDLLKSLEKKLFENKFDRITMFENLLNNIQRMVKESKGRAKEFREEITEHKNEILHRANLDLEGVDSTYYDTTTAKKKLVNNALQRAVLSSTYTFEQFLKFFGKKAANGEGYLYNYFTKLNQDALDEEQLYNEMNRNALDEKTKELFGKEKFMKLVGIDGKNMKEMDVKVTDYSNKETGKRTIHLKQGQMLYIYLVNKETDGEMKLRAMGITEEDVAAIEENLDPRVKAMGEWLQDEYLPECQRRYQATHTKYFGAPMKEVENYFPLAINNRARNVKEDVNQDSDAMSQLAGTSTGAIVTRRVNVIPLDIENADAFEVAFNHLQEMEEWSAMLPFRQDINTLLSYTHFRNQVQNMSSVAYGSGKTLWDEFKQTAQIAAGTYKPKVNAGMMDSRIAAAMGGIAVAKISGRLWTAIKQTQSATVFLPECDFTRFVKNGVNPYGSWKWAMENIPDFRKRIENITYGDVKLRQYLDELEKYHDWTKVISKWGMAPNILVDGITCAVGARSVYETEVSRLTKLGYPKEKAEEKAYYKAVAAYNKTQQSSGGMYLSPMQVDRTYVSAALSLFKNANYAYGRMQIEACRGLARTYDLWGGKHKTTLIESMTRQIMEEDGLDENTARAIAKATYNRTFRQSIGRLINFATLVPVSWALYKVLPYLLTGDDDDKKKDMIEEAVLKGFSTSLSDNYVIPFASNILNAGLKVEDGKPTFDPEVFRYQNLYINPATSDLANIYSMVGNQKWYSVANKLGMLGVQSLIGFNPETVGALYQAVSEADYDNGNTAKEWQIGILKAISAPEESIRELYMDELGLKSGDIKKIPLAELEKRYAERQINRDNLLSQIVMDAETFNGYVDKYQKSFEKKIKDKMDKWDEYDKKKADEFFDTTSDPKLKDMIEKKRTKNANAAADEQIAKEGLNQEKKGKEPSEEAYDAVKMSIDVAEDNAISTYNKVLNKRYAALNDEYNNQTDAMKYIFMSKHPNFKSYKDLESEYTTYGKKMKELKEKLVSADGYDAKQTILKQIRAEREKFSELQSKVR